MAVKKIGSALILRNDDEDLDRFITFCRNMSLRIVTVNPCDGLNLIKEYPYITIVFVSPKSICHFNKLAPTLLCDTEPLPLIFLTDANVIGDFEAELREKNYHHFMDVRATYAELSKKLSIILSEDQLEACLSEGSERFGQRINSNNKQLIILHTLYICEGHITCYVWSFESK